MALKIVRSTDAAEMLRNESFRSQWARLYQQCPWATATQSPAYVTSWYEAYKRQYSLVLVSEFWASGALAGFLPLGLSPSGQAVLPGARQAEYKGWLALSSNGKTFFEASLKLLSRETDIGALSFRYLPSGAPVTGPGALTSVPWICELEPHRRPIIRLVRGAEVAEYIREKTNKTIKNSFNRLKRVGNVRLVQIREKEELVPIFDQLIEWYDVRQEMAHGKRPFRADKNKKTWHLNLLKEGLLHLTLLKAGQETVSALFGLTDGKTYSVVMPMFAPEYVQLSPIAIHHLLLVERLHAEGYSLLDLTPGPDPFKERFASEYETVNALSIYFNQREWIKAKVRKRSQVFTKGMLSVLGIEASSVMRTLPRIQAFLRFKRPGRQSSPAPSL